MQETTTETKQEIIPDMETHFLCRKCKQWKANYLIGSEYQTRGKTISASPIIMANEFAKSASLVTDNRARYICISCRKKRRQYKKWFWIISSLIILAPLLLDYL